MDVQAARELAAKVKRLAYDHKPIAFHTVEDLEKAVHRLLTELESARAEVARLRPVVTAGLDAEEFIRYSGDAKIWEPEEEFENEYGKINALRAALKTYRATQPQGEQPAPA